MHKNAEEITQDLHMLKNTNFIGKCESFRQQQQQQKERQRERDHFLI